MRTILCESLLITIYTPTSSTGAQNLSDLARQYGGTINNGFDLDVPIEHPPELTSPSDLVLQGKIVSFNSHLSPDEPFVVTDYMIAPTRVLKQKRPLTASKPGEPAEVCRATSRRGHNRRWP
jgi:hypothetical protein